MKDKLYIIIPVFNEEAAIERVVNDWSQVVEKVGGRSKLVIINDGSTDGTGQVLDKLKSKHSKLLVVNIKNQGHGPTILMGYKLAIKDSANYVFMTDSDNQTDPGDFWVFWDHRAAYSAILGHRTRRKDGVTRQIISMVLKIYIWIVFKRWIPDPNVPYRLLKTSVLANYIQNIPINSQLSNVALTVLLYMGDESIKFIPIHFYARKSGRSSVNVYRIGKIARSWTRDVQRLRVKKRLLIR